MPKTSQCLSSLLLYNFIRWYFFFLILFDDVFISLILFYNVFFCLKPRKVYRVYYPHFIRWCFFAQNLARVIESISLILFGDVFLLKPRKVYGVYFCNFIRCFFCLKPRKACQVFSLILIGDVFFCLKPHMVHRVYFYLILFDDVFCLKLRKVYRVHLCFVLQMLIFARFIEFISVLFCKCSSLNILRVHLCLQMFFFFAEYVA